MTKQNRRYSYNSSYGSSHTGTSESSSEDDLENPILGELISKIRDNQAGEDLTVTIKINLKDGSLQALGEALAVNNSIKKLSIKNIFVDKAEAATFAHCVAQNKSIKELDLFNNIDVSGNFMRIILENNQNIETLNIRATPVCLGELAKTIEEANFCVTGVEFTDVGKYANGANDLKKSIQRNFDIKTRNEVAGVLDRDDIFPDALKGLILDYVSIKPSTSPHPATASSARQSSDKSH